MSINSEQEKALNKFTETTCAVTQVLRLICRGTEEEAICDMLANSIEGAFCDLCEQLPLFSSEVS